jgi:hypothetical protein
MTKSARTNFANRVGRGALGALVAAATILPTTQSFAAPAYDGTWSVLVVTKKGTCDAAYRYPIRIAKGTLINAGDSAFTVSGKVAESGAITVTVSAGGKSATGSGRLAGAAGGGSWTGGECSGLWTAERRGA